jgi:SET domain-containing protein
MKSYKSPKVENRQSGVQGVGLFAKEDITFGEIISIKGGVILSEAEAHSVAKEIGDYYLQIEDNFYISPAKEADIESNALQQNHSCEPNMGLRGPITFVAMRDIGAGEELFYDIAFTTAHSYQIICNCGKPSCRGTITGEDWKRMDLQKKYKDYFSPFIQRKMNA